jgi:arginase
VALIGAASSAGARQIGQEQTPALFRQANVVAQLRDQGIQVLDLGDLPAVAFQPDRGNPKQQNLPLVAAVARQLAERVERAVEASALPVVIGGDCTVTLGVLAGLAQTTPELGLLYFDGDVDLRTPATTETGILDGMGLAHILGDGASELSRLGPRHPLIRSDQVVLFGYQSAWAEGVEQEVLARTELTAFPLDDVAADPRGTAEEALAFLSGHADRYLLHFDVDVVDYLDLPVADVPHFSGLPFAAAAACLERFLSHPSLAGVVMTEFNALHDPPGAHARHLIDSVASGLAGSLEPRQLA